MERKEKIDREVRATLELLESAEPLAEDPWFSARVLARLDREAGRERGSSVLRLANRLLSPVLVVFIIALNVVTAVVCLNSAGSRESQSRGQLISTFVAEFAPGQEQSYLN